MILLCVPCGSVRRVALALVGAALGVCAMHVVTAATPGAADGKSRWATLDQWPDLGDGEWQEMTAAPPPPQLALPILQAPLQPKYRQRVAAAMKLRGPGGSGSASCEPEGVIVDSGSKFFLGKDIIVIGGATDRANIWRRVYLRPSHHGDPEPTYFGDSIGHWEGTTLVIDTTAIRAEAQLISGVPLDSTATHLSERIRLVGPDKLEWTKTVENSEIFTRAWTTTTMLNRVVGGDDFPEAICWKDREAFSGTEAPNLAQ